MDQRISEYGSWDDVRDYCRHSADPVGRLVLGVIGRAGDAQLVDWSDDVCTGLQLVNFLQDVPRDLALGRVYLPVEDRRRFGVTVLDEPNEPLTELLEFEADRASGLLAAGERLRDAIGGRTGKAVGLFARVAWPRSTPCVTPAGTSSTGDLGPRARGWRVRLSPLSCDDDRRGGLCRRRAADARAGAQLLVRDHVAAQVEAAGYRSHLRVRARGRRHRGRPWARRRHEARAARGTAGTPGRGRRGRVDARRAGRCMSPLPDSCISAPRPGRGGLQDTRQARYATFEELAGYCRRVAGAVGVACVAVYGADEPKRAETLGVALQLINIIRDVAEDWGLGRVYLPQDELARFGVSEEDIGAGRCTTDWRALMAHQARARAHLAEGRTLLPRLDRRSAACVAAFANLYAVTLDRIEERGFDVFGGRRSCPPDEAPDRRNRSDPPVNVAVVGGGLAGLAAALELADQGHAVALYEARPTLGGAVQTLPEREGDPEPPPDNGQHIALGCFTEYLRFLDRIGEGSSYRRLSLELPVIAGDGRTATIGRSAASFLRYHHLSIGDRLRVANAVRRLPQTGSNEQTFGALLSELGCPDESIEGFWDVFIRPALNLRSDEVSAEWGVFTVRTALLADRAASDLILLRPAGLDARRCRRSSARGGGRTVRTGERVTSLDDLDGDAVVVATPPAETARLLGEPDPGLEHSPIVSVHLVFDRPLLAHPLAALLDRCALGVRSRSAHEAGTRGRTSVFDGGVERGS